MAAKRKMKRLGSAPDEHVTRAGVSWESGKASLVRANQHMSHRDCRAAMAALKSAALNIGAAQAEAHGAVGSSRAIDAEKKRLNAMVERFKGACVKSPREMKASKRRR